MARRPLTLASRSLLPILLAALLICAGAACGRERILSFDSRITLHRDGTALVQETIRVASAGDQMRGGIHRDIPTAYWDRFLLARDMGVGLVSVQRDGRPDRYDIEAKPGSLRVYLGGRYPNLSTGRYAYTLTYTVRDPLRSSLTRDALSVDITGHDWSYSIDATSALITLPPGVPATSIRCRCATLRGPRQGGCDGRLDSSGRVLIRTSGELRARDGLVADVSWPRGYVALPSPAERLRRTVHDNLPICYGLIGLLAVTAYYLLVWSITRRYTPPSTVEPVTDPPDDLSPGAMHYIYTAGHGNWRDLLDELTAALVDMAVRGHLRIVEANRTFTVTADPNGPSSLPNDEAALAYRLFSADQTMVLKPYNQRWRIPPSMNEWRAALARTYQKRYFPTNSRVTTVGLVFALLAVALPILAIRPLDSGGIMTGIAFFGFGSFAVVGVVAAVSQYIEMIQRRRARMPYRPDDRTKAIALTVFAIGWGGLTIVSTSLMLPRSISPLYFLPSLTACFVHGAATSIVKILSPQGRALLTRIQGFRGYLAGAYPTERNGSPSSHDGPELFERYLPYAIALGVSHQWASRFTSAHSAPDYLPTWYAGDTIPVRSPSDLADVLSGSFMEAAGIASQPESSQSAPP